VVVVFGIEERNNCFSGSSASTSSCTTYFFTLDVKLLNRNKYVQKVKT